ncbi:MAG: histidine kinase [Alphaproteobacteria bacterium]|nr:MAG: histidine kinase [Alphaproteobacteria bacterium]
MTHFLVTDEKPDGYRLEDILSILRRDIIKRSTKIMDDERPEAKAVLNNSIRVLGLLSECISIAEDSTRILEKSFGKSVEGKPRIGKP